MACLPPQSDFVLAVIGVNTVPAICRCTPTALSWWSAQRTSLRTGKLPEPSSPAPASLLAGAWCCACCGQCVVVVGAPWLSSEPMHAEPRCWCHCRVGMHTTQMLLSGIAPVTSDSRRSPCMLADLHRSTASRDQGVTNRPVCKDTLCVPAESVLLASMPGRCCSKSFCVNPKRQCMRVY